ncbi:MAG TPA: CRTAC1 family protein, partial [Opitutus sp.]|nr:CRTAC1 family protein [Opitutus sp.]
MSASSNAEAVNAAPRPSLARDARAAADAARAKSSARAVPPLLPVLGPVVLAAIATGVLFAWWFPPAPPGAEPPAVRFTDVTAEAGLSHWSAPASADAPTTLGGGVVCFDYDTDGDVDLFFVGGAPWPWEEAMAKQASRSSLALVRNDGRGRFTEVTAHAGLNLQLQGMGAAAGDFDRDGRPDLYVTCVGANHLFRNLGHGRFEDVTEASGVGGGENTWSTGAAWLDVDADGQLDLVVGHYARWSWDVELRTAFMVANVGRSYGAPTGFTGAPPSVYRNLGGGKFSLVPGSAGLRDVDAQTGLPVAKTLAVVPVDPNEDGKLDLLFSYHASPAALFVNQGNGTFRRWTAGADRRSEGAAAGMAAGGMLTWASPTEVDGRFTAWRELMHAESNGAVVALPAKFGAAVLDLDHDGRLDVFSGGGRAEGETNRFDDGREFAGVPEVLWNRGNGWSPARIDLADTPPAPLVVRGVATADFDGDGDFDVVMAQAGGTPRLWRNEQRGGVPWLHVDLVARDGSDAAGARVEVHTPRRVHAHTVVPAMSLMAQSATTLNVGLGEDARVRKLVVHWPNGARQ